MTNPYKSPHHAKQKGKAPNELESIQKLRVPAICLAVLMSPVFLLSAHTSAIRSGAYLEGVLFACAAILCGVCVVLAFYRNITAAWAVFVVAIFLALVPAALLS